MTDAMTQEATSCVHGPDAKYDAEGFCSRCGANLFPNIPSSVSAPDSGLLPSEIEAAMDWLERSSRGVGANAGSPLVKRDVASTASARAELTAKLLKWGEEQYKSGRAEAKSKPAGLCETACGKDERLRQLYCCRPAGHSGECMGAP